ncbi:hypothetical protein ACHAXS_007442, partial [Conticribra weissflogii]
MFRVRHFLQSVEVPHSQQSQLNWHCHMHPIYCRQYTYSYPRRRTQLAAYILQLHHCHLRLLRSIHLRR